MKNPRGRPNSLLGLVNRVFGRRLAEAAVRQVQSRTRISRAQPDAAAVNVGHSGQFLKGLSGAPTSHM